MIKSSPRLVMLLSFLISCYSHGQTVENLLPVFDGDKVTINYDLNYVDPKQEFVVRVFSSHDNYTQPLNGLTGDYGNNVLPGKRKQVIWDARNTLPANFDQEINIRIRITMVERAVPKLALNALPSKSFRKGKAIEFAWTGGAPGDKIKIELLKDNVVQSTLAESYTNSHRFSWVIPKKSKSGKNYGVRITNTTRGTDSSSSDLFVVKAAIPLFVKLLPVAGIVFLFPRDKDENLPGPMDPD